MTVKLHGGCAEYNGVGNTWWKYVGGGSSFEERDANLEDVVTWNLNMQAYKLGYCKMVRGRMTMTGI
jgi:hypothetical protein